jgi:hypothetical protein
LIAPTPSTPRDVVRIVRRALAVVARAPRVDALAVAF